jgi:hypothetical protein
MLTMLWSLEAMTWIIPKYTETIRTTTTTHSPPRIRFFGISLPRLSRQRLRRLNIDALCFIGGTVPSWVWNGAPQKCHHEVLLPNLTRVSLADCGIGDDGLIALVTALEQNSSLPHLDLRVKCMGNTFSERSFLAFWRRAYQKLKYYSTTS